MTEGETDVDVQLAWFDREGLRWARTLPRLLAINVEVGQDFSATVAVDPGMPTRVTRTMRDQIAMVAAAQGQDLVEDLAGGRCLLRTVKSGGHEIADINAQLTDVMHLLGVDGVLGFEFFSQYAEVCLEPSTLTLSLKR